MSCRMLSCICGFCHQVPLAFPQTQQPDLSPDYTKCTLEEGLRTAHSENQEAVELCELPEPSSQAGSITLWQFESVSMKVWSLLRCINGITIRNRRRPGSDNWFARMTGAEGLMDPGSDAECQNLAEAKSHFYSECNERMRREARLQCPVASMSPYVWPSLNLAPEMVTMKGNEF